MKIEYPSWWNTAQRISRMVWGVGLLALLVYVCSREPKWPTEVDASLVVKSAKARSYGSLTENEKADLQRRGKEKSFLVEGELIERKSAEACFVEFYADSRDLLRIGFANRCGASAIHRCNEDELNKLVDEGFSKGETALFGKYSATQPRFFSADGELPRTRGLGVLGFRRSGDWAYFTLGPLVQCPMSAQLHEGLPRAPVQ